MYLLKDIIFSKFLRLIKSWKKPYFDFSQLGEEKIINNILERISHKHKFEKYYVDIGCYNPIRFSNTYKLYQKGWSGIVIEPNINKTKYWKSIRPNDLIINSALVPESYGGKTIEIYKNGDNDPTVLVNQAYDFKNWNDKVDLKIIKNADHVFGVSHPQCFDNIPTHLNDALDVTLKFLKQ